MNWGPIDADWGSGFEDFDVDPFADPVDGSRRARTRSGDIARLPRQRRSKRGTRLERSLTAPRPRTPGRVTTPRAPRPSADTPPELPATALLATAPPPRRAAVERVALRALPDPSPRRSRRRRRTAPRAGRIRTRFRLLILGLVLLAALVIAQLVRIQVVEPDRYVSRGEAQRERTVILHADRGRILDRSGKDLALSVLRPSVYADPLLIADPVGSANRLGPILGLDVSDLAADLVRDTRFVYLARHIDDATAARIVALDVEGVRILEEPARFTPSDDLARGVIGKVAPDQTGSTGIEFLYDEALTGTPGEIRYERAPDGSTIAAGVQSRLAARSGLDVVLTLDRSLQYEAERLLADQVGDMGAAGGTVVVTRPATGEILALANITRNTDDEIITAGANRAVIDVFEPGSVNKVITIAAALEEGLVQSNTTRVVPWQYRVSDHTFTDDHAHPADPMTITDILAKSSNVGTIMLGQELGKERIDQYLRAFGFGTATALGFRNESRGLLLPTENWSGTSIGSIPIGQGIAVTAMQMLSAYNIIANDGLHVEPRLVSATIDGDGVRRELPTTATHRVVSADTARQVRDMLIEAVDDGTGGRAHVPGYSVGGKTGTARKPQETGTYQDLAGNYHYVAVFTGMVPAEDPELSIIVVIDEPTATIYGGGAAAPVFADLAAFALNRFRIPPVAPVPDN